MADKLLSPEEVAEVLNVTPKTVREWLRKGELQGIKTGKLWRIREQDLNKMINPQPAPVPYVKSDPVKQYEFMAQHLTAALGRELTEKEDRFMKWLGGWDWETYEVFGGIFQELALKSKGVKDAEGHE